MPCLLPLACSQKKTTGPRDLPAIERHDGATFRASRRDLRERPERDLTVLIFSAKYGLIESARAILDCRLPVRPEHLAAVTGDGGPQRRLRDPLADEADGAVGQGGVEAAREQATQFRQGLVRVPAPAHLHRGRGLARGGSN